VQKSWVRGLRRWLHTSGVNQLASRFRVKSIELNHFKCFENLRLDFDRGTELGGNWTCIAGINGAGKSSILQAIALLGLGDYFSVELGRTRLFGFTWRQGMEPVGSFALRADVETGGSRQELQFYSDGGWSRNKGIAEKYLILGYGPSRTFARQANEGLANLSLECARVYSLFETLTPLVSQQQFMQRGGEAPAGFERLFSEVIRGVLKEELALGEGLNFTQDGAVVGAEELPDGYRSTVAWLADLVWNWTKMRPEGGSASEIEALVLIDEIDPHLHPQLQRTLVPRLRKVFPGVQWIVTTHSPLVLSCFDKNEIILLDRDREGGVERLEHQVFGLPVNQVMERLMGARASGAALEDMLAEAEADRGQRGRVVSLLSQQEPILSPVEIGERLRRLKK